ncbi:uncharacterized protein LOC116025601 isoform X4 [Ipomoea triloba]|uniref:uncharacterized protein LOC116025601 isoform X4 n=1 Tax=Ipomoea triloba TaxID=35885 RepID=UPI00125DC856|nr:uncharacterized protein LOC116025601 isoform X4 [Ipomoea triloba]
MASNSPSVSTSPSTQGWTYDVFLSFRGPDTRKTFIDFLYESLERRGIRTFKDDDRLEKGDCISTSLIKAIQESQFLIAVFSEGYASSKWCLEELATMMECHETFKKQIVVPIFHNVEPSDVRKQEGSFGDSFKELVERFVKDEEEEKVRRWKEALKNAGYLKGHHLQNDYKGYEATCAEKVAADIDARLNRASLAFEENLVGLESRVNNIGNWLRLATDDNDDFRFIGICGMGGIGKTTIATCVFNKFSYQFDGACFLVDIRQHNVIELQKTLLTKILKERSEVIEINNAQDGIGKIKRRLKEKKVLIVLDDVDNKLEQLDKLAGGGDWFGRGSRVIITTRDAGVLRSHGVDEKYIYPVHTLRVEEGIQLFISYAFKKKPKIGVEQLCGLVVRYCKGLPLALKILGSSLCGLEAADWESTLEELKDTPNDDIDVKLKISFDRLDSKNKKIFLHIACYFRHQKEEHVKEALKSCNLLPAMGLRVLVEKSLISVEEGNIEMHDLIQEMGWRIARDEKHSSRVWEFKEVDDVLCGKMDPKHIEFMLFPYTCGFRWQNISNTFEALKILIGKRSRSYDEEGDNNYQLPSSLRWLHFPDYPFSSLPTSFHPSSMDMNPSELVGLCLHRSSLENCWITKELNKLTYLDLSSSGSLLKTPKFDMMPNLRSLDLSHCSKLKEIHPSVGRLEKLVLLDLSLCWQLQTLPCFVQVSSLRILKLESCSELENFPEIQANMPLVLELNLDRIGIRELPSSIGRLRGLTELGLCGCNDLVSLSDDLCELENLKILELRDCPELESLPEKLGNLSKLEELHIIETAIFQLPSSIAQLSSLECLCWGSNEEFDDERGLKFLPSVSGLRSLKKLQLSHFRITDEGLPSDLGQCLISLEYLNLEGSKFDYLPESFGQLPHLQYLDLRDCEELEMLPELPKTIRELYMHSHFVSGNKSINIAMFAIKYPKLYSISFSSCGDAYDRFRGETFLVKETIQFPFHRKTPFSVSYSSKEFEEPMNDRYPFLRSFQYQRFKSNRICFDLNPYWYSTQFGGFAVYFVSYHDDMWEPHSYEGFDRHTRHCVFKAKLSSHNDIHEDLKIKCVIAGSTCYNDRAICFVYVPFSSLWPESKPITEASDYSRFEVELVNLKASADWGINLLYKSRYTFPSLEGAREHMGNYHRSDSEQSNEEAPLFEETPVLSTQPEPVVRNQTKSLAKLFKRHEEENTKANVEMWKEELKKDGEISGYHLRNDFNGFKAKCVEIVTHDGFSHLLHYTILKDNFVGLETRVGYVGKLLTQEPDDVQFIGILGMKGIGKTTIAMVVFHKFWSQFDEAYYLVDVKEHKITELQEALLGRILNKKMGISNEVDGMKKIGGLLGRKKVLIVLDDVDQVEQLQKLAGRRDWFGKGSRVIITTRDVGVLRSHGVDKKYVYKVHTLEYQKAIQLFSCYAFKSEIPATGFELLSELIVYYCKGFPLALKVLGSSLYGLEVDQWESTLKVLKGTPIDDIHAILKISFDRLDSKNKNVFLHIACLFRNEKKKCVKEALNALQPGFLGMRVLIEKSFISVEDGIIKMHHLIQEMGWRIARDEKHKSRVWEFKEVDDVLCGKMDSKHIESIVFPYTCGFRWQNISNAFKVLKILIGKRSLAYNKEEDTHSNAFEVLTMNNYQFPSSLELIHFPDYPFPLLPTSLHHPSGMDDNPLELAVISSHRCSLGNCRITEKLNKLTYLNLSSSCSLLETPNFDMMPNLEKLYLSCCEKLVEIHPSVGYLKKLVLLDLSYCCNLRRLPRFIQVSSLQFLKLECCQELRKFPEIQENMPLVLELNLRGIRIRELPSSIGRLRGLTMLCLCQCEYLVSLSDDLCELESLKILELRDCDELESLPENLGNLSKLKELHIIDTAIFQLPSSITQLSSLECLCWGGSSALGKFKKEISLKFLPSLSSLRSLKKLRLSGFKIIDKGLPSDLGQCLISLEYLNLVGSNFDYLLESFSRLPHLQYLDITYCEKLPQQLPATIRELYATSNLASESNMAKLAIKYPKLYSVSFSLEHVGEEITFSAVGLARKFAHAPFQIMRNSSFIVTYPIQYCSTDRDMTEWFKYSSYHSNKISVSLKSSWFNQSFVGFVVCFILKPGDSSIWKLCPDGFPFRYGEVIAQLVHKDNEQLLQTNCVIGRQDHECNEFMDTEIICFAYIPFHSLFNNELSATPSDYLVFEVGFGDAASNALTDWSCGLLYQNDESLSEAIWSKTSSHHNGDSVPNGANLWEFTKVVNQVQCQMVSMPECSDTKVVRLLYTNSGGGILALSSNGIQELWKWPNNEQNPTGKRWTLSRCPPCTCSRVGPDDVVDVNLEKVAPCIDLYKNDSYIVSAVGRKVSFFNTMTFEVMTTFRPYATPTFLVVYPYNNNVIAIGTENGTIILYNVRVDEVKVQLFKGWCKRITGLAFSTTDPSILVSSSADAKLCVWDIGCGWCDIRSSVRIRSSGDTHVMFHTDQLHLLVTHETQLAIYHISNMKRKRQWIPQGCLPAPISSATYSCNSQLVYASFIDGNIGEFEANNLTLRCRIAPSAYLSQPVLNSEGVVYAVVIAAHPQEPNQLAIGLTDGSIKVIEPLKSEGEWGISPLIDIEIQNGKEGEDEGRGESLDGDEVVEEYEANESNAGHGVEVAMSEHNDSEHGAAEAAMAEHSAKSPIETSVCKTVFEAPKVQTTEKRKAHTQSSAFYKRKEGDIFIISDQQVNEEDDDEEEGGEEEDKQRKKARLDNNDKVPEDIIINSGKQNKGKNEQNDGRGELLAANVQPLFVDDDVFQCLGNDCKKLYDLLREGTMEYNMDCIGVELDANIFHHTNVERIFVVIKDIKDLFTMNWLDVSVIQVFIMYLYQLCKEFEVSSIGFMCPTQIAKDNVDRNSKVVMAYLRNTMSKLQDKTFILAPYHQVNHWLLLVICTSARMVYVLDPMQCDRDLEIKPVLNMAFRTFTNQQGQRARWKNIKCPRQPGNSECGYYVMRYMYDICKKYFANTLLDEAFQETEAYSDKEIDEICNMWAKYFLNECV